MDIRNATVADIPEIMRICDSARNYMRANGNHAQWINGYPSKQLWLDDIAKKQCFVCEEKNHLCAVFAFILGEDPTYLYIENGQWKNDLPYGTIHRLGSDGTCSGIMEKCKAFALSHVSELRADTHEDNKIMQAVLERNGFEKCGIIYIEDGSPRIAYQFSRK